MRGCDLSCTFCIVPAVRGRVLSRPVDDLVAEARWLVAQGARAITLLGQTVNSYGEDLPAPAPGAPRGLGRRGRPSLADLLRALQEVEDLARIRLITLHPAYVTVALAEALRDCDKVERCLPLPAQSGSDRILRAMRRGYTTDLYRERVALLRERVPDLELGSDWIVGFPGETDADFQASEAFLSEIGFAGSYVFQYSPRPGTDAEALADDVPAGVKGERNARLLARAASSGTLRHALHVGARRRVLVEGPVERPVRGEGGWVQGRSQHGLPVRLRGDADLAGREVEVTIEAASAHGLTASRIEGSTSGRG